MTNMNNAEKSAESKSRELALNSLAVEKNLTPIQLRELKHAKGVFPQKKN